MGFKLPEGPLQNGRTYIYVRIWSGFPKSMDTDPFSDVLNDGLGDLLGRIAAKWVRDSACTAAFPEQRALAKDVPPPPEEFLASLSPQTVDDIGNTLLASSLASAELPIPWWVLLHAEDTLERAHVLAKALPLAVILDCPVRFLLLGRHEVEPETALVLERQLEDWNAHLSSVWAATNSSIQRFDSLRRFRAEALRMSKHLLDPDSPHEPRTATSTPVSPPASELEEKTNSNVGSRRRKRTPQSDVGPNPTDVERALVTRSRSRRARGADAGPAASKVEKAIAFLASAKTKVTIVSLARSARCSKQNLYDSPKFMAAWYSFKNVSLLKRGRKSDGVVEASDEDGLTDED